jgi:hypothetical protein
LSSALYVSLMRSAFGLKVFIAGAAVALAAAAAAHADADNAPSVTVIGTDPNLNGELGNYESLYVKFSYRTAQRIVVEIDGLSAGKATPGIMSGGIVPASPGSGEHILWIAYKAGTAIDGLRVGILDPRERPISHFDLPAHLRWVAKPWRAMSERPQWVQQKHQDEQRLTPMAPPTTSDIVLGTSLIYGLPFAYLLMQAWFALFWSGGWRKGALMPLILMAPAALWSLYALADGSNLAPLPAIFAALLGFVYLAVLWLARTCTARLAA